MVPVWVIVGLIIAATSVSIFGAVFSIFGLGALFSGAMKAVFGMAAALEFAKFVLAAYLHQRWSHLNIIFKSYLTSSVVVLSLITSMGVFGFLSDAYQSASHDMDTESVKLANLKTEQNRIESEIAQINRSIDEIPATRITKKMQARAEAAPAVAELNKELSFVAKQIGQANLQVLQVKQKVGPLLYISKAFNMDIDLVVKYLILLFVVVFDPLAICLVIATSESLNSRKPENQKKIQELQAQQLKAEQMKAQNFPDSAEVIHMSFSNPEKAEDEAV